MSALSIALELSLKNLNQTWSYQDFKRLLNLERFHRFSVYSMCPIFEYGNISLQEKTIAKIHWQ